MATILDLAQKTLRGEVPPPPIGRLLGFVLKAVAPGRAVFEMDTHELKVRLAVLIKLPVAKNVLTAQEIASMIAALEPEAPR
jgi:hypothetical protein